MIHGYVDQYLQAKIPIAIVGKNHKTSTLEAVVDTGFTGDLCISIYERNKTELVFSHTKNLSWATEASQSRMFLLDNWFLTGSSLVLMFSFHNRATH